MVRDGSRDHHRLPARSPRAFQFPVSCRRRKTLNHSTDRTMNITSLKKRAPAGMLAAALTIMAAAMPAQAASPPTLNARLVARPVTPGDIGKYGLPASTETSGGMSNVGVGTPIYLEVEIN